jgi:hypothetical protein
MANPSGFPAWWDQFTIEHGYAPDEDPNLLAKGFDPGDAVKHHWNLQDWAADFAAMTGKPPSEYDYRYKWFGQYPPERIAELQNQKPAAGPAVGVSYQSAASAKKGPKQSSYSPFIVPPY